MKFGLSALFATFWATFWSPAFIRLRVEDKNWGYIPPALGDTITTKSGNLDSVQYARQ